MEAGALIMLLFAVVLMMVVLKNLERAPPKARVGPIVIGIALLLFAIPIYASVTGSTWFDRFAPVARIAASLLLPIGLYLLTPLSKHNWRLGMDEASEDDRRDA
jgi:hypothetical protein